MLKIIYIHKANQQLQNKLFYRQNSMDLTEKHKNQVNEDIDELQKQNLIS